MTLLSVIAFVQASPLDSLWETAKGVMLSLITMGVLWLVRLNLSQRDDIRDLKKEVGIDGSNGLKTARKDHDARLQVLEKWKVAEDAITEIEKELMQDTGQHSKRLRDKLNPSIGDT